MSEYIDKKECEKHLKNLRTGHIIDDKLYVRLIDGSALEFSDSSGFPLWARLLDPEEMDTILQESNKE